MIYEIKEIPVETNSLGNPIFKKIHIDDTQIRNEDCCTICQDANYPGCKEWCGLFTMFDKPGYNDHSIVKYPD